MFQYRQALVRLRQGDPNRDIARSGLMGRPKVALFRALAESAGWLAPEAYRLMRRGKSRRGGRTQCLQIAQE